MDKLAEKLGLFDLWVVFFPGAIFTTLIKSTYTFMTSLQNLPHASSSLFSKCVSFVNMNIYSPSSLYDFILWIIISYFLGLVIHEFASFFKKKCYYTSGSPCDNLLDTSKSVFNLEEIQFYLPMMISLNANHEFSYSDNEKLKRESRNVFNQMNIKLQDGNIAERYVKLNIIHNLSNNLSISLLLIFLFALLFEIDFLFSCKIEFVFYSMAYVLTLLAVGVLFMHKSKKYYVYWVRNIVRAYYSCIYAKQA